MKSISLSWAADTELPLSLAQTKTFLRISSAEFDDLIDSMYLPAAVQWAEGYTRRSILAKTHYWVLQDFPSELPQAIYLPRGKTQSVTSIAYTQNNATTTLTGPTSGSPQGTGYRENLRDEAGGILYPNYNATWPDVDTDAPAPVLITYSAGWTKATIPADIKNALALYCWFAIDPEQTDAMASAESLLNPWRLLRA